MKNKPTYPYLIKKLLERDGKRCCGCGMKHQQHGQNLEADHVYSKSQLKAEGREDEINLNNKNLHNFQLLCRRCNLSKGKVCFDARYRLKNFKGRISEKNILKAQLDFDSILRERRESA